MAHLSNVFPSWTDYYCVIKLSLGCFFSPRNQKNSMSFQEFQFSKVAFLSVRWQGTHGYLPHRTRARSRQVATSCPCGLCSRFLVAPRVSGGGRLPSPPLGGLGSPGKAALESGAVVSVADSSLCEPRGSWTLSLRRADLLPQASRGRAQNPCVPSSAAWLLSF